MDHEHFMRDAIEDGRTAKESGGRPFASILVKDGQIVAREINRVVQDGDPTSHAELNVIRSFCTEHRVSDLQGYTLYTTCEPCPMCAGAIAWANVSTVVVGADRTDGPSNYPRQVDISCEEVLKRSGLEIELVSHVLREECAALFR